MPFPKDMDTSISFKVYLALRKSHGDMMPWHLLLLKMALRAFTKIYNNHLRLLCYSREYSKEAGKSLCSSAFVSCSLKADGFLSISLNI